LLCISSFLLKVTLTFKLHALPEISVISGIFVGRGAGERGWRKKRARKETKPAP